MDDSSAISVREGDVKIPQIASCGSSVFCERIIQHVSYLCYRKEGFKRENKKTGAK